MAFSRDLFLSILALDSYNRGYGAGVNNLNDTNGTKLGMAEILSRKGDPAAQATGFYGIAYSWNNEKIISYRGTDNYGLTNNPTTGATDLLNGWTAGLGYTGASQLGMAAEFYKSVSGASSVYTTDPFVTLTGHSLGGSNDEVVAHNDNHAFAMSMAA
jgi:hypothetical protein